MNIKRGLIIALLFMAVTSSLEARVWTSRSGKGIDADFIAEKGEWIYLMKKDGKHLKIRISDLCEEDRTHIYYQIVKPLSEAERQKRLENANAEIWLKNNTAENTEKEKPKSVTLTMKPIEDKGFVAAFEPEPKDTEPQEKDTADSATPTTEPEKEKDEAWLKARKEKATKTTKQAQNLTGTPTDSSKKKKKEEPRTLFSNLSKQAIAFYLIWLIPPFIIRYAILRQPIRHLYSLFLSSGVIYCAVKTFSFLSNEKAEYLPLALVGVMAWGIMSSSEKTKHVSEIAQIRRCPSCKKKIKVKLMEASSVTNCPKCNAPLQLPKHNPSSA